VSLSFKQEKERILLESGLVFYVLCSFYNILSVDLP
jgi:hypothetical protein